MILPVNKKFGINYLIQPFLTPQLGIFSKKNIQPEEIKEFLNMLAFSFGWARLNFNKYNTGIPGDWEVSSQKVYELDLISPAHKIYKRYAENIKVVLKMAENEGFSIMKQLAPNDFINLWKKMYSSNHSKKEAEENKLRRLFSRGIQHKACEIYGVYSSFNNLIASSAFFNFNQKTTLLISVFDSKEANELSLIFLIHQFIKNNAGQNLTLKFELPQNTQLKSLPNKYFLKDPINFEDIFRQFGAQEFKYTVAEKKKISMKVKLLKSFLT
ncbi:MAG: hypothetical protein J7L04_14315 [Bacteroidales bacterium]|nr:hypothetical protein [Bacteroidales bacterium]